MPHADILDEQESLRGFVVKSILFHAVFFLSFFAYGWWVKTHAGMFGSPQPLGGGAVGIEAVRSIPLPGRSGNINPLANDTQSQVPVPERVQPKPRREAEDKDAIALQEKKRLRKEAKIQQERQRFHPQPVLPNQVTSTVGQALVTRMVQKQGSGGIGANTNSALGNQFGWYLDLVKQRIAQKWDTTQVDARVSSAPPVVLDFDIHQDGSISAIRIMQSSGNPEVDFSAQRAILQAAPFPNLPGGYSSAPMEILFQLRR
jgi:protein TonB